MLSGLAKEESKMKNYTITVSNEYGKESATFELEVIVLYCEEIENGQNLKLAE